jgi:hypothetical protein
MADQTEATRQSDWILPMMTDATSGKSTGVMDTAGNSVLFMDLSTLPGLPASFYATPGTAVVNPSALGHYIDIDNQGAVDVHVLFGPTKASVTGANAPNPTAASTIDPTTGAITLRVGVSQRIPAGQKVQFKLPKGSTTGSSDAPGLNSACRYLAYITASSTAVIRVNQSSI